MNIALPFSNFHVEQPGSEFAELAAVVAELAALLETSSPGPEVHRLRERAEALVTRLHR